MAWFDDWNKTKITAVFTVVLAAIMDIAKAISDVISQL